METKQNKKLRRRSYSLWYGSICFCASVIQHHLSANLANKGKKKRKRMEKHVVDTKWLMDFPCRCDTVFSIFISLFVFFLLFLNCLCSCAIFLLFICVLYNYTQPFTLVIYASQALKFDWIVKKTQQHYLFDINVPIFLYFVCQNSIFSNKIDI